MNSCRAIRYPLHLVLLALYTAQGIKRAACALALEWRVWWAFTQQCERSWKK